VFRSFLLSFFFFFFLTHVVVGEITYLF
jgi:hypothetical protein